MRRNKPVSFSILLTASVLLLSSSDAFGYSYNESPNGDPVRWLAPQLTVVLDTSLSRLGEVDEIREAVEEAFEVWTRTVAFPFDVELVDGECGEGGAKIDGVSCIFAEDAAPADSDDAGATTFVRYRSSNGAISEADVVFYESSGPWGTSGSEGALDVFAVASHEIGHVFGLGHSDVALARMYPTIASGDQWEGELSDDDVDGAKALYEGVELDDETGPMSCSVSGAPGRPGSIWPFLAVLLALGLVYLRRIRQ